MADVVCGGCCWREERPNVLERALLRNCFRGGSVACFRWLLRLPCVDVNCKDEHGNTPLVRAVQRASLPKVVELLARGADPLLAGFEGVPPFHLAALKKEGKLLEHMCRVCRRVVDAYCPSNDMTALQLACTGDDLASMRILLRAGADPDLTFLPDPEKLPPLSCLDGAVILGNDDIVVELLLHNCQPVLHSLCRPDVNVFSVTAWAALRRSPPLAARLVRAGCPLSRYWESSQCPDLPRDSQLLELLKQVPRLCILCRTEIRAALNARPRRGRAYRLKDHVDQVLDFYRPWELHELQSDEDRVRKFLMMSELNWLRPEQFANEDP